MDTQIVEVLGRQHVIEQMLRCGVEVAVPVRDHGIDLVAYIDRGHFRARPLQLKTSSARSFAIDNKYREFPELLMVHIWNVSGPEPLEVYALDYEEATTLGESLGWTATESWTKGKYVTSSPSRELIKMLQQYRVDSEDWRSVLSRRPEAAQT